MKNIRNKIYELLENSTLITEQQKEWIYYLLEDVKLSQRGLNSLLLFLKKDTSTIGEFWEYLITDKNAENISLNVKWNKAKETVEYIRKLEEDDEENQEDIEDLLNKI